MQECSGTEYSYSQKLIFQGQSALSRYAKDAKKLRSEKSGIWGRKVVLGLVEFNQLTSYIG
ncbi:predicted protein [Sclerotinia sclerotiorum 1980 UF-70]|uniref:Uncharacterized protein n=1 Tax=Sclerotinia sclerotiorum (strain ATCC 18683 / 1980 / Ss-1) TaxID=665079 RepID=A7F5R4_SCLS1|nr:predicted protein [Sclerotinia sclerotiorum 1980 UF-70]EDN98085.1 predicted protein [Sclerotinia sclerotiorum 1980 UF-70]